MQHNHKPPAERLPLHTAVHLMQMSMLLLLLLLLSYLQDDDCWSALHS
jgi:hypothetical protein